MHAGQDHTCAICSFLLRWVEHLAWSYHWDMVQHDTAWTSTKSGMVVLVTVVRFVLAFTLCSYYNCTYCVHMYTTLCVCRTPEIHVAYGVRSGASVTCVSQPWPDSCCAVHVSGSLWLLHTSSSSCQWQESYPWCHHTRGKHSLAIRWCKINIWCLLQNPLRHFAWLQTVCSA